MNVKVLNKEDQDIRPTTQWRTEGGGGGLKPPLPPEIPKALKIVPNPT